MDYEPLATDGVWGRLRRLEEYRDTVSRLFPALPKKYVDLWTLSDIDALVLGYLLDHYPREVVVLDVGTFVGASAFHFAGHPKVSGVIGVDPNPAFADEINDKSEVLGSSVDPEPLQSLRVLDVARAALAEFADEHEKIQLREGVVGSTQVGVEGGTLEGLEKMEVPEPSEDTALVAFVDGLHTREGVRKDLEAIFERNPRAVALLDDCRHAWGPYVQAGVADFMEGASRKHRFRLLGDLGPGLATSGLGMVYSEAGAAEAERTLSTLRETFSGRLDPLLLLAREEELIGIASELDQELEQARKDLGRLSRLEKRNSRLEKRNSRLERHNSQLIAHYSGRRFKLVDVLVKGALWISIVGRLMRRKKASPPSDESS